MLNKHGQSLIIFIIIMPLLILLLGGIIEISIISYQKKHLTSLTKTIIASCIASKEKNDIISLYNKNGVYEDIEIFTSDGLEIKFTGKAKSFLGKIVKKDNYSIQIDILGKMENDKIIYEKGNH